MKIKTMSDFDKSGGNQKKDQGNTKIPVGEKEVDSPFGQATGVSAQLSLLGRGIVLK